MPLNLNNNEVTSVDLNNTDVSEVRLNGDTVFTSAPTVNNLPVAYSNLIAWYPFDAATYGGSNADDVTAILGGSGDDTAYDGTVNGATYQSSGGATDINAGQNSGAFDFDGSDDKITTAAIPLDSGSITLMFWVNLDQLKGRLVGRNINDDYLWLLISFPPGGSNQIEFLLGNGSSFGFLTSPQTISTGTYTHLAVTGGNGTLRGYQNGAEVGSLSYTGATFTDQIGIGTTVNREHADGQIDDVRLYNRALTGTEVNQIYQNSKP